jgi:(2Fe-2S) ferredoxin
MVNGEDSFPIHLHLNGRLVTERQPKAGNPLILSNKLGPINPEGSLFGRVAGDFHDREIIDQLTISGCLGPCDLSNVVTISNENGTQWFEETTEFEQYRDLVDWAARSRDAGELLPLPREFQRHTLHPFRK